MRAHVIEHAFILCCDAAWSTYADGALAVDSEGRIAWVGAASELPAPYAAFPRRDARGLAVIPGLVNTHCHAGLSLYRGQCDRGDLFAWAECIGPHTSTLTLDDVTRGTEVAVSAMLDAGVTCACDCTRYGAGLFADVAVEHGMRSLSGALANSPELRPAGRPNWPLALQETLEAIERHAGDPLARFHLGAHSPYSCTPQLVAEVAEQARRHGLRFIIHLAETAREVQQLRADTGLGPAAWLDACGALGPETLVVHGVWLDEADLDLVAARGASVAHCPGSNAKLGSGVAPLPAMLARGIPVGLGSDSMLSNNMQDVLSEARLAVLLQRATTGDATFGTAREALSLATLGGARALGWADEIGSLEPGKFADYIGVRIEHPLGPTLERVESDLVYSVGRADVELVIVAGRVVRAARHREAVETSSRLDSSPRRVPGQ
jgi:5-methylthioadenosine/S-adenosylhomocysteine deaminase